MAEAHAAALPPPMAGGPVVPAAIMKNADALLALGLVTVIVMMIVPIPAWCLDIAIAANITVSLMILLTVVYTVRAIDFAVFPALLLVTTIFRLSINVSSTRLILLQGLSFEGQIIRAFGDFVVGGSYVVGVVIFAILVTIQFMVIVKGATRIAEVAARFTLDAMPGKQLAIDADLNQGIITEKEAQDRRKEIRQEADFYGAMDGASKFVQGDVVAGLIITFINIVAGFFIGVIQRGEPWQEAAATYTILTIGDGLVAQIPSFLVSISAGLIVARAGSGENFAGDLVSQTTRQPRALYITSGVMAGLGILTPLPTFPMLLLAGATAYIGRQMSTAVADLSLEAAAKKKKEETKGRKPEDVASLLTVDPMEVEIGYALIPLVDPEQGGDLLERITMIRRQMALDLGLLVPPIRIRDNMQLKPNDYAVKIKGVEIASGALRPDHYLAMNPGTATAEVPGEPTKEPAFGLPARWIRDEHRERAELAGFTVVDPPSVLATHLTEVIKRHAAEILGRQETQRVLDEVKKTYGAAVEDAVKALDPAGIHRVLSHLLREGISIRDMVTILETIAEKAPATKDPERLGEFVRAALHRSITKQFQAPDGTLHVVTIDPRLEEEIVGAVRETPDGRAVGLEPRRLQRILERLGAEVEKVMSKGAPPALLVSPRARLAVRATIARAAPTLAVLSYNEVSPDVEIKSDGIWNA